MMKFTEQSYTKLKGILLLTDFLYLQKYLYKQQTQFVSLIAQLKRDQYIICLLPLTTV